MSPYPVLLVALLTASCNGDSGSPADMMVKAGLATKPGPKKGQLSETPQVLLDAKGKSSPITWSAAGRDISFVAKGNPGNIYARFGDTQKALEGCRYFEAERGDRIELMLRRDADPTIREMLHVLCIEGGSPGSTKAHKTYVERDGDELYFKSGGSYEKEGVFYEPVGERKDALHLSDLTASDNHSCGIRLDGTAVCWGDDLSGSTKPPTGSFTHISVDNLRSCGIRTDKTLICWGAGTELGSHDPVTPPEGTFVDVAVGHSQLCAIRTSGETQCWSLETPQKKAKGTTAEAIIDSGLTLSPVTPPAGDFISIKAAYDISCGLLRDGSVKCWGGNVYGVVSGVPAGKFTQIELSNETACALSVDGTVACWGELIEHGYPPPKGIFTQIAVGSSFACAIAADKSVTCWGSKDSEQLDAPSGSFVKIAPGDRYGCGIKTDKTVTCWGKTGRHTDTPPETMIPLF